MYLLRFKNNLLTIEGVTFVSNFDIKKNTIIVIIGFCFDIVAITSLQFITADQMSQVSPPNSNGWTIPLSKKFRIFRGSKWRTVVRGGITLMRSKIQIRSYDLSRHHQLSSVLIHSNSQIHLNVSFSCWLVKICQTLTGNN